MVPPEAVFRQVAPPAPQGVFIRKLLVLYLDTRGVSYVSLVAAYRQMILLIGSPPPASLVRRSVVRVGGGGWVVRF